MFLSPRGIQKSPRISILPWDSDRDARAYHPYVVPLYFMLSHALIADGASHLLVCHPSFSSNGQVPAPPTQEPPAIGPFPSAGYSKASSIPFHNCLASPGSFLHVSRHVLFLFTVFTLSVNVTYLKWSVNHLNQIFIWFSRHFRHFYKMVDTIVQMALSTKEFNV